MQITIALQTSLAKSKGRIIEFNGINFAFPIYRNDSFRWDVNQWQDMIEECRRAENAILEQFLEQPQNCLVFARKGDPAAEFVVIPRGALPLGQGAEHRLRLPSINHSYMEFGSGALDSARLALEVDSTHLRRPKVRTHKGHLTVALDSDGFDERDGLISDLPRL